MSAKIDLTSQRFGRLVVVRRAPNVGRYTAWGCICDCGNYAEMTTPSLRSGNTRSCGCLLQESVRTQCRTHGLTIPITGGAALSFAFRLSKVQFCT